jgi:hypothetical protein
MPFLASQGTSLVVRTAGEALPAANMQNRARNPFNLDRNSCEAGASYYRPSARE